MPKPGLVLFGLVSVYDRSFLEVIKVVNCIRLQFDSVLLVPVKWLTGKTISYMTYNVLSETLPVNIQPNKQNKQACCNAVQLFDFDRIH